MLEEKNTAQNSKASVSNGSAPNFDRKKIIDGMLINSEMKAKWESIFRKHPWIDFIQ